MPKIDYVVGITRSFLYSDESQIMPISYIGLPLRSFTIVKQQDESGCWAASLAMVCRFYEVYIDEHSEIALSDRRGGDNGRTIAKRLAGIQRIDGRPFVPKPIVVEPWSEIIPYLIAAISRHQMVILGLREDRRIAHAVVAIGAELDDQKNLLRVIIADPGSPPYWNHTPTVEELSGAVHEAVFVWDPLSYRDP